MVRKENESSYIISCILFLVRLFVGIRFRWRVLEELNYKTVDFGILFVLTCKIHFSHSTMLSAHRIDVFTKICFVNPKISNGQIKEQL